MAAMRHLMTGGAGVFASFVEAAHERIGRGRELLATLERAPSIADVDALFQLLHTLKGEARSFDLADLEAEVAGAEDATASLRQQVRRGTADHRSSVADLGRRLTSMQAQIARARDLFIEASPIGESALDQITVQRPELRRLEALTRDRNDEVGRTVRRLAARPFGELAARLVDGAPTWAAGEGKQLRIEVQGKAAPIPAPAAQVLRGVLTHLVRNAVAHGIEPTERRRIAGKPDEGHILIACQQEGDALEIVVADDGAGLDEAALRERGNALNLPVDLPAPELAFAAALLTAPMPGELAGRGVGLPAVRHELAAIGWEAALSFEAGRGTRVVIRSGKEAV